MASSARQIYLQRGGITMRCDVDPQKPGKGRPDVNSSLFLGELASFAAKHPEVLHVLVRLQDFARTINRDPQWLLNIANAIFINLDNVGLDFVHDARQRELWLLMSWCVMYCAESQLHIVPEGWTVVECTHARTHLRKNLKLAERLRGSRAIMQRVVQKLVVDVPLVDMSLLPRLALHRLGIHQELCVAHAGLEAACSWKREGLRSVQRRMGSAKRHFDAALHGETDVARSQEDHLAHLVWNCMAIFHTCMLFPHKNDHKGSVVSAVDETCLGSEGAKLLRTML